MTILAEPVVDLIHWAHQICFSLYMQDKADWTICDTLKGRVETFKRTMPLIQDLKNPAMRDRHWQQLKQEVQKPFDHTSKSCYGLLLRMRSVSMYIRNIHDHG